MTSIITRVRVVFRSRVHGIPTTENFCPELTIVPCEDSRVINFLVRETITGLDRLAVEIGITYSVPVSIDDSAEIVRCGNSSEEPQMTSCHVIDRVRFTLFCLHIERFTEALED